MIVLFVTWGVFTLSDVEETGVDEAAAQNEEERRPERL